MIEEAELLYQKIAEAIQEAIFEEWITAKMEVIFYPDTSVYFGEYIRRADGVARGFRKSSSAEGAFREIRKRFKEAGKPLWGRACFELQSDGRFDMKWGYDDCDEDGNARYDEDEKLKRHEERHKRLTSG
jgi:hypothetical protein